MARFRRRGYRGRRRSSSRSYSRRRYGRSYRVSRGGVRL